MIISAVRGSRDSASPVASRSDKEDRHNTPVCLAAYPSSDNLTEVPQGAVLRPLRWWSRIAAPTGGRLVQTVETGEYCSGLDLSHWPTRKRGHPIGSVPVHPPRQRGLKSRQMITKQVGTFTVACVDRSFSLVCGGLLMSSIF